MAGKCVHKGCGKTFDNPEEDCVYHPGPPVFHEGQKGWKCCKPRVLTFEEFLSIPPCTTGKHSTVDDTPAPEPSKAEAPPAPAEEKKSERQPISASPAIATAAPPAKPVAEEPESDDPDAEIPANATCRRKSCGKTYTGSRDEEKCVHHPGQPVFHEGSKGWSCCKRRVLEFDEFLKIPGCTEKTKHLFVGKAKAPGEEKVDSVRNDFYQTPTSVNASLYLKKIDKERAKVDFTSNSVVVDLPTTDNKRFQDTYNLFASIDPEQSTFRVLGTKLELNLAKADGTSWPVLRSDDKWTGERIQIGNAGRA
ncbi:uncharacterized protein N7515_005010 [Penicillium bovifimosum]|uniref:Uncharacterized protein n=1 Tax=Penicillium bovifimosum TaxID=126998 RepID=A0A9W9H198_9EURO|nr:uncharacterized protein N7515_005010 [Penicillium bovifimosum]KAJ5135732.1 hypothetical protein N7515_005010 [Penicillium bovifimosum]